MGPCPCCDGMQLVELCELHYAAYLMEVGLDEKIGVVGRETITRFRGSSADLQAAVAPDGSEGR